MITSIVSWLEFTKSAFALEFVAGVVDLIAALISSLPDLERTVSIF